MDNQKTQLLYLHRYLYGGGTTFTAHLVHTIMKPNETVISRVRKSTKLELKLRDFGYGLRYQNINPISLKKVRYPFITLFTLDYSNILPELNRARRNLNDVIVVIHDPTHISQKVLAAIKKWKIITIRKTVQHYIQSRFGLQPHFLYHPFHSYPTVSHNDRIYAISISRISYEKNTEIILRANRILNISQAIRIYGTPRRLFYLLKRQNLDFNRYYYGQFEKSFYKLSEILSRAKFVVDLSVLKNDGGGTQYTFLEAIHNGCALIVHRKWLDGTDPKYCDLKEGYNCFAVENEKELADIIKADPDTTNIVNNAKKLMRRHIRANWSHLFHNMN